MKSLSSSSNWWWRFWFIINYLQDYSTYLIIWLIILFLWFIWLIRWIYNKVKKYILLKFKESLIKKLNITETYIDIFFITILIIILSSFIFYEFLYNTKEIKDSLYLIFTYYISLYIIIKILVYSYKITFWIAELDYIDIKDLKKGDIIDKWYLVKMFWTQVILWAEWEKQNKKWLLYPNPDKKINELDNPIDKKWLSLLNNVYKIVNVYHKKQNPNHNENNTIKILNTFSFSPYLLFWFLITFIYQNEIFKYIVNFIIETMKKLASS